MWVLTEDGELVNLAHVSRIQAEEDYAGYHAVDPRWVVVGYEAGWRENEDGDVWHSQRHVLSQCDDEEHGKEIVARLAPRIARGSRLIIMGDLTYRGVECRECGELYCDCQGLSETA